jgi:hypothetical protein
MPITYSHHFIDYFLLAGGISPDEGYSHVHVLRDLKLDALSRVMRFQGAMSK